MTGADTVDGLLDQAVERAGGRPAVGDRDGTWSYSELARRTDDAARWLTARGVRRGDRVVLQLPAGRCAVAALYATARIGAVAVPAHPASTAYQLRAMVADADPGVVLTGRPDVAALFPDRAVVLGADWPPAGTGPAAPPGQRPDPDDLVLLVYTSGSTSPRPKGVMCTHRQVLFATAAVAGCLAYRPDDVVLCRLPLSFDYGLYQVFLAAVAGCLIWLCGPDADVRLVAEARRIGATVLPVVPSLATMLLGLLTRGAPPPVRLVTNTGEQLPAATRQALRERLPGVGIQLMFGITECKRVSILERDGDLARPDSVGRPLPGTEVRIIGPTGRPLPAGEVGEITVRGPHVMAGYWRAPDLTARTFRVEAGTGAVVLHTGDFGRLDADGHLTFAGRRDQLFKRAGVRTSALEIETAARDVAGVTGAVVLPPAAGRDAVLVVAGRELSPVQVLLAVQDRLGPERTPDRCEVLDVLPTSSNGKVDRVALAALAGEVPCAR